MTSLAAQAAVAPFDLRTHMTSAADDVVATLERLLPPATGPEARVKEAMRYAAFAGGKRLRPFLVLAAGRMLGADDVGLLRAGAAIEAVHTYSLVHDDLPAMDDDDLRRGRPTTHKAFDDATAILAGDALLTIAFEWLAAPETHADAAVRAELVLILAKAAGADGMVGGQMVDLVSEGAAARLALEDVKTLHAMKTGALITAGCAMGAALARASQAARAALDRYGRALGLAFQIADDILDVEGSSEDLGKTAGKDEVQDKSTFVSLLGLEGAKAQARATAETARRALDAFGPEADPLRDLALFVVARRT